MTETLSQAAARLVDVARHGDATSFHAAGAAVATAIAQAVKRPIPATAAFTAGFAGRRGQPWDQGLVTIRPNPRMSELALRFPSLRGVPGTQPWNASLLDDWAATASSVERLSAAFLLWTVYNAEGPWRTAPFELHSAWAVWDAAHRAAALTWLNEPFGP